MAIDPADSTLGGTPDEPVVVDGSTADAPGVAAEPTPAEPVTTEPDYAPGSPLDGVETVQPAAPVEPGPDDIVVGEPGGTAAPATAGEAQPGNFIERAEAKMKTVIALHHIQHDNEHFHPGDTLTVPAAKADEMVAQRSAAHADSEDAQRQLKQANAARQRALTEAGAMPAVAVPHRRHDDPPGPDFDTTPYPAEDEGTLPGSVGSDGVDTPDQGTEPQTNETLA